MKKFMCRWSIMSYILGIVSILLFIYSIWAGYHTQKYISAGFASGQIIFSGNELNIAGFYMTNSIVYIIYGLILLSIAFVLRKPVKEKNNEVNDQESELEEIEVMEVVEEIEVIS